MTIATFPAGTHVSCAVGMCSFLQALKNHVANHKLCTATSERNEVSIPLIGSHSPRQRGIMVFAKTLMPRNKASHPLALREIAIPDFVELGPRARPLATSEQKVVPLGNDKPSGAWDGNAASDGLTKRAIERRCVDHVVGVLAYPTQQGDVASNVKCVGRALTTASPEAVELDVGKMEPIHRNVRNPPDRWSCQQHPGEVLSEGGLARTWAASDAKDDTPTIPHQRMGTHHKLFEGRHRNQLTTSSTVMEEPTYGRPEKYARDRPPLKLQRGGPSLTPASAIRCAAGQEATTAGFSEITHGIGTF
jgi:hypothetical protein